MKAKHLVDLMNLEDLLLPLTLKLVNNYNRGGHEQLKKHVRSLRLDVVIELDELEIDEIEQPFT